MILSLVKSINFEFIDPLEQFELMFGSCVFFTNFHQQLLLLAVAFYVLLSLTTEYPIRVHTKSNILLIRDESFGLLASTVRTNVGSNLTPFFPILYISFTILFLGNLLGLAPYSLTLTSTALITFFFSVMFTSAVVTLGYGIHSDRIFQLLLPSGVPLFMAPFLVIVEGISYAARVCSLAVRLFANMLSGHGLLKILVASTWVLFIHPAGFLPLYVLPLAVVTLVSLLELTLAFLQAYVFLVLVCIYLNDVIHLH
jgi:ATP synthase subunit 6